MENIQPNIFNPKIIDISNYAKDLSDYEFALVLAFLTMEFDEFNKILFGDPNDVSNDTVICINIITGLDPFEGFEKDELDK